MMTLKQAEKKGYVPTKIEIDVLMHPETGNILYICDGCGNKAYDRYAIISDPAVDTDKPVNILCKDHKKRYHKHSIPPTLEGLIRQKLQILLNNKWTKLSKRALSRLHKKHGWFNWLYPED
jgi:hypothetical protein